MGELRIETKARENEDCVLGRTVFGWDWPEIRFPGTVLNFLKTEKVFLKTDKVSLKTEKVSLKTEKVFLKTEKVFCYRPPPRNRVFTARRREIAFLPPAAAKNCENL